MAMDSTNLPLGETTLDAGIDTPGSDLDPATIQVAQTAPANYVDLPKGNTVILLPVQPGQTVRLPTDTTAGLLAKIGPEGNLAIVVDGRTIILQGYLKANDQSPIKIVTNDGDSIDVADLVRATDPALDIQTAAGPAAGAQGEGPEGSGIYVPFLAGPGLGGILAEGILDPTALRYRLIDDDYRLFTRNEEDSGPTDIDITFDILGGILNEDDLPGDQDNPDFQLALVVKDQVNDGTGNDPFDDDTNVDGPRNDSAGGTNPDGVPDSDREPLTTQATVNVTFPAGDVPGTLEVFADELPDKLTSEGGKIIYEEVVDPIDSKVRTINAFVDGIGGDGKFDPSADPTDRLVFDIKVLETSSNSIFHVDFTLYDNIDNDAPDADGNKSPDLLGADEQVLDLPVKLTASDEDGDGFSKVMNLGVQDDIPFFGETDYEEGEEGGIVVTISNTDADIAHDETWGIDGDADDVDPVDLLPLVPELGPKIIAAGFSLPFESEGATIGTAQTQIMASFGADQATQEQDKPAVGSARNSIFGELEDITNRDGDNTKDGENEQPFELFMMVGSEADGAIATQFKNPGDKDLQTAHLSIEDQPTNATVTWFGKSEQVFLHQIDAQTIVGYILVEETEYENGDETLQALDYEGGESKELVFVLHIDDNGVLSFAQFHQLNHNTDGPTPADHDDTEVGNGQFQILGEDGTPLIHVRISDFDGDHATQPVNLVIQDDGPKFVGVEYDLCQTEGEVQPTNVHERFDDLSSWTVLASGIAEIVGDIGTSDPQPDPADQALLVASGGDLDDEEAGDGASQQDIEDFFGLSSGALDGIADDGDNENGEEEPTDGSAIKKTFNVHEGDILTVKFNFLEDEGDGGEDGEGGTTFQDFAFIVIGDQVFRLSNVSDANDPSSANAGDFEWDEESGYLTFTHTFTQSGPVQIGFGVMNEDDTAVDPGLLIDELKIEPACEGAIDEDDLKGGIEGGPGDGIGGVSVGGNIEFDFGVDRPGLLSVDGLSITDDKGVAIAFADLETADGNGVEWGSKTGPDLDGWVTWTAVEEGTGDPVFVFKLDTAGGGQGEFVFELKQALSHPFADDPADPADTNTAWEDNLHFNFAVKATDVDGDWTSGNVRISVDDDSPDGAKIEIKLGEGEGATGLLVHDETAGVQTGDDDASDPDASVVDQDENDVAGPLAEFVNFEGDNALSSIGYAKTKIDVDLSGGSLVDADAAIGADRPGTVSVVTIVAPGGGAFDGDATNLFDTATGNRIFLYSVTDDTGETFVIGRVGDGINPDDDAADGAIAFALHVNDAGELELGQYRAIKHPETDTRDESVTLLDSTNESAIVYMQVTVTDADGDSVTVQRPLGGEEGQGSGIMFQDDGPTIVNGDGAFVLALDESVGGDGTDLDAPEIDGTADGPAIENDEALVPLPDPLTDIGTPIGAATAEGSGLFVYDAGADKEASHTYSLTIAPGGNTGLTDTARGQPIVLSDAGLVEGLQVVHGKNTDGDIVFALSIDPATGKVSVAQYLAIDHDDNEAAPGAHDELVSIAADVLSVSLSVTDKDGDTATHSRDIGGSVTFDDDAPDATPGEGKLALRMDESVSLSLKDADFPEPNDGIQDGSAIEGDVLANAGALLGSGLPLIPVPIGAASGNVAGLFSVDFGSDKAGDTTYALEITLASTDLVDTQSQTLITLVQNGGIVEGRDGLDNLVFAVTVNPDTGAIVTAQYRAIDHGDEEPAPGAHDEVKFLTQGTLAVVATATDKDGDSDSQTVDISGSISFDDDGPKFVKVFWGIDGDSTFALNGTGVVDEDKLPNGIVGGPGDGEGGDSTDGEIFFDFGSDQPGKLAIEALSIKDSANNVIASLSVDGNGDLVGANGLKTADGQPVIIDRTTGVGGLVTWTAYVDLGGGTFGDKVFTFALDTEGGEQGEFEFTLLKALDHPFQDKDSQNNGPETSFEDNLNLDFTIRGTDGDGDSDTGHVKIIVDDDSPDGTKVKIKFDNGEGDNRLVHDETKGVQDGDDDATDPDAAVAFQDEDDVAGPLAEFVNFEGDNGLAAIGYAQTALKVDLSGGTADADAAFGADLPGTVSTVTIVDSGGGGFNGTATNLKDTATGTQIFLFTVVDDTGESFVVGRVGNGAANPIAFALHVNDSGTLELAQYRAIQHPDTNTRDESVSLLAGNGESAVIHLQVTVTDADGDAVTVKQAIDGKSGRPGILFQDDGPTVTECHERGNLLINGSFEDLGTEDDGKLEYGDNNWGVFTAIPGWTSEADAANPALKPGLEIQGDLAVGTIDAQDGEHYLEVDSDRLEPGGPVPSSTNATVHQDVATEDGHNYVLSFYYSPRVDNPATTGVEVRFDGQLIATINSGTVGQWDKYTFVVQAGDGDGTPDLSRLEFKAIGTSDQLGGFIDNVSLTACALVDEDALPNGIEGGPGDDGIIGASFSGSLGVDFGADGGKSIVFSDTGQPNLTSGGAPILYTWVAAPGGLGTLIGHTGDTNDPVFTVVVNSLDNGGEYTFTLLKKLDHPDSNNNPGDDATDDGTGSFEDNLVFDLKFKATDRDDDTVEGKLKINVDDDSPTIADGTGSIALATDETLGGGADVLPNPGTTAENDEAGAIIPGVITAQVADPAIGFSQGSAAGLFNAQYGADGPGAPDWGLVITGGGATGLTDTATNTAITLVAGLNGVVLGKANGGAGPVVFAFSIDGSGTVTMVQYRAVNHGATEAAPGDHDEAIFMNAGVLGVTLSLTDFDGDAVSYTRDISGQVSIDDDGPHANCDYDSVTEGEGNYATGNVATGISPEKALLGIDANGTDGIADNPGQDQPYTISKLAHDGDVYQLSADGLSVTKNGGALGAGESFAGGKLTIVTAEGATFEIILISATQSEVGEYKYTPGPNPIHDEDVHVGPADLAATRSTAFDTVDEWAAAFIAGGINLVPAGGALAIKNVDVEPKAGFGGVEDYRGIGVNTGIDSAEVDTDGESLTLEFLPANFPGGVNNAALLMGALFDGQQFDSGNQEILKWEAYDGATLVASGQIVGDFDGLVTLDIDTADNFNKIVLTPLSNGAGSSSGSNSDFLLVNVEVCEQAPVKETFDYTLRDGDGDESTASLKISVEDTFPVVPQEGNLRLTVDEDGLPAGVGNNDSPNDAAANSAAAIGNIPFTPGADPVSIELSVGDGGDTGLQTLAGQSILAAWDAATGTLIGYIAGTDPSNVPNQVFKMTVTDAATGAVTFELLKPIKHADIDGAGDNTENAPDPVLTVNVEIEDKDCDVAFTTVKVVIDDDMPVIARTTETIALNVDETLGGKGVDFDDPAFPGAPQDGSTIENDEALASLPAALTNPAYGTVIGADEANGAALFSFKAGADGLQSAVFGLAVAGDGDTGLIDTGTGFGIRLVQNGSVIEGRADDGDAKTADPVVFALAVDPGTGEVSMAQYRAINHGSEEGEFGAHDEVATMLSGKLSVTLTVTDKDGDSVSDARDISGAITFDDDGPIANADVDSVKESGPTVATGNVITGADGGLGSDANATDGVADTVGTDGLKSITWSNVVEAGVVDYIQGTYGKLHVDGDGNYKYELDLADPDTKALTKGQVVQEVFNYTIQDKDGDFAATSLTINVEGSNEPPVIDLDPEDPNADDETAVVSDEGLPGGNPDNVGVPSDDTESKTFTSTLTVSDPDLPGDTLTVAMQPGVFPAWNFSDGQPVSWSLSGDGLTLTGTAGGNPALTVAITPAGVNSHNYTVTLHQPLDHPDPAVEDELSFNITVRVTDSAGEFDEATLKVEVEDDSPKVTLTDQTAFLLAVDETVGGGADVDANGESGTAEDGSAAEGDEAIEPAKSAVVSTGLASLATDPVIGAATADADLLFTASAGADGEKSRSYVLEILGGGLTTIKDVQSGLLVTLVHGAPGQVLGMAGGNLVFALDIDESTGQITVAQFRAVDHGTDQPASYPDEVIPLGAGVLQAKLTVTDKDDDSDFESADLGSLITFDDDGPKADLVTIDLEGEGGDNKLIHDETKGDDGDDDVPVRPTVFANFEDVLHPTIDAIGYAATVVNVSLDDGKGNPNAAYGSDGPGTTYLSLTKIGGGAFDGQQTNLRDTETTDFIFLFTEGDLVVGRIGADKASAVAGDIAFALSIEDDGDLALAQYRAVQHPDENNHDDAVTLLGFGGTSSVIQISAVVTDKDGDSVTVALPLDGKDGNNAIVFEDDGPKLQGTGESNLVEEDDINNAFSVGNNEDGSVGKHMATGSLLSQVDFGTDGAAAGGGFSLDASAIAALTAQGLTSKLVPLTYGIVGDTLTASAGAQTVFTLKVEADGNYTFTLVDQLDHHPIALADNIEGFLTVNLGAVVRATDGDGDSVHLTDAFKIDVQDDIPTGFNPEDKSTSNNAGAAVVGDLDFLGHVGTDEPATVTFTGFKDGDAAKDVNGDPLKSQGEAVLLYGDGTGLVTGKTGDGDVIFTVTLDPGADTYSFNLNRAIDDGGGVVFTNLSGAKAGQKEWARIDNFDTDLLITPIDQVAGTINTDVDDIGVADQFIDNGEGVRIDFVKSPAGDETVQNGYSFANHYLVNEASFSIIGIGGGGTASLKLRIVKADDDTNLVTGTDPQDVVALLSASGIDIDNNSGGAAPTITDLGGGYFQIDGLDKNDTVTVTGDEAYNRLEIEGLDGKQFSIGALKIGTIVAGDPVTMNFDVKLTDKDGDYTEADFNVTVVDRPVTITDLTPSASGGDATVYEKGLPAGTGELADGDAANNSDPSEATSGTFKFTAPDGLDEIWINGVKVVDNGAIIPAIVVDTPEGHKLTVTSVAGDVVTYSYVLQNKEFHGGDGTNLFDNMTVKVTDKDGDQATDTLSVKIVDDAPLGGTTIATKLDDESQPGGIETGTGDIAGTLGSTSGTLAGLLGADGGSFSFAALNGTTTSLGTETVNLAWNAGNNTLTGTGPRGELFTIQVTNPATGAYTFTLKDNVLHATGNDENDATLTLGYKLKDSDNDSADGTFSIILDDDTPQANELSKSVSDGDVNTNLMLILDVSGSMDDPSGLRSLNKLELAIAAMKELIEQYDAKGDVRVQIVTFTTNAAIQNQNPPGGGAWLTAAQAKAFLDGLDPQSLTNYDDALLKAIDAYDNAGKLGGTAQSVSYFLSDGIPTTATDWPGIPGNTVDNGINASEQAAWEQFLRDNDIDSFALGFGKAGDVTPANLEPIDYNGKAETDTRNAPVITDLNQLTSTLVSTVSGNTGGNLFTDSGNGLGADRPGRVSQFTFDGTTFTFNGATITQSGTARPFTDGGGGNLTFATARGTMNINMSTGVYSFALLAGALAGDDVFGYTLRDADGDTAANDLTITVTAVNLPPIVRDDHIIAAVDDGEGGDDTETIVVPEAALLWNDTDANGDPIDINPTTFTNVSGFPSNPTTDGTTVTISDGSNGGSFTYTGKAGGLSDTGDVVVDRSQEGDSTLNGDGLDNIIVGDGSEDDNETLNGFEGNDVLLGNGGNDTLTGGLGRDWLQGGAGNDRLAWDDEDLLDGGAGRDTLFVSGSADQSILHTDSLWLDIEAIDLGSGSSGDTVTLSVLDVKDIFAENGGVEADAGGVFQVNDGGLKNIGLFIYGDGSGGNVDNVDFSAGTWTQLAAGSNIVTDDFTGSNITFNIWKGVNGGDTVYVAVQSGIDVDTL